MATPLEKLSEKKEEMRKSLLPSAKTPPKAKLEDYNILLYGHPKVGKSTWCSAFDNPIFAATEKGLNTLEVFQVPIPDWLTFLEFCRQIAEGQHVFKNVIIDPVDNLYDACSEYVCKKAGIQHESDLEWGKGWSMVNDEFSRAITKLSLLPYGLVMTSHAQFVEIKTRTGSITKAVPTMSKGARDVVLPMCDFILYMASEQTKDGQKRILRCRPSENWDAGTRFKVFPAEIPLTEDEHENHAAFKAAFEEAVKHGNGHKE